MAYVGQHRMSCAYGLVIYFLYGDRLIFWCIVYLQLLRPIYKQIAENQNAEIFSANTLLVILGTSLLTARVGELMFLVV